MRKSLLIFCVLAACYGVVELTSFLVLARLHGTEPNAFAASETRFYAKLDDDDLRAFLAGPYHPVLGWDNTPGLKKTEKNCLGEEWTISYDADGARSMPGTFPNTVIAAYGDSYIRGGEVNDDQTWTYQFSKSTGMGAKNYGVGAFGTYQAMLKAKLHISQGNVYPVTILGVNEENIRRVLNVFRPFLSQRGTMKFSFMPGLYCEHGNCSAIANPLRPDVQTVEDVKKLAREARQWDYWARQKPIFEYPWSLNLFKLARLALGRGRANEREPLWHEPNGIAAMHWVISEFRTVVKEAGSLPVVLFFPQRPQPGIVPSYTHFKQQIAAEFPDLLILDVADNEFDARRFKLKPTACHPSEYGHSIIADTVRKGLSDMLKTG
jgi:hypothetical protein